MIQLRDYQQEETAKYATQPKHYVYTLGRPDGSVFYVGQGSGYRIIMHEIEVRANEKGNTAKHDVIRQIWANGGEVTKKKVAFFDNRQDALIYEWFLINIVYGRETLTNMSDGGKGPLGAILNEKQQQALAHGRTKEIQQERRWTPKHRAELIDANKKRRGEKRSPEHIERIRQANLGRKMSTSNKEKLVAARVKTYPGFLAPDGTVYRNVTNLAEFARQHKLHQGLITAVANGKRSHHQGWKRLAEEPQCQ